MFEKFLSTNSADFRQRYNGTYGFFSNKGKRVLVRLVNVSSEGGRIDFVDAKEQTYRLNVDADDDIGFDFLPAKSAWHNTENGAYLVRRRAARQFSQGICQANTNITRAGGGAVPVDFAALSHIFEHPSTAKAAAERGDRVIALSEAFAINLRAGSLYLFESVAGTVKTAEGKYVVTLEDVEMFGTEVRDAFRRAELEATVQ